MKRKLCWTVQGTDPCLSCGNHFCVVWHPQQSNPIQQTKTILCFYCFSWAKHFSSHGPASDERYCSWTSRAAHLSIQSSNPKHCRAWWWSWLGRLAGASWGLKPWRRFRSTTDGMGRALERHEHKGTLQQQEACIPLMAWIHGTELRGDQMKTKSGQKNTEYYWKIRNEVQ